ncbi:MAG TPA: porin [Trinickia sp.]|uniref:porin n=1 Tax=Trinickia sp. TaxID=2571163 RepID=UPI002BB273ED|nr:porin [Trinickia sp.]HTI18000.1 porin [Trinickia sp.]
MKKIALSTLSLALMGAAGAAHAQSSVTLYGIIDTSFTYVNHVNGNNSLYSISNTNAGDLSGSRWGLKGTEDLGGGLSAIFQLENGFDPGNGKLQQGSRMFGRQAFVGLQSNQYGTVTLGRQYDPSVDLVQAITEDNYFGSAFATPGDVDNYDNSFRVSNAIKYLSPVYAGFQVEGMYAFGGVPGSTGQGMTWALGAAYNNGPIALAASYVNTRNTNPTGTALKRSSWTSTSDGPFDTFNSANPTVNFGYQTANAIKIVRVAGQYTLGQFTLGASFSNALYTADGFSTFASTQKYNTAQGFVNYQLTPAMLLGLGYNYTHASGDTNASYNQVSAGADYSLSKRTDVYLVGAWQHASGNQGDASGGSVPAVASVGSYGYGGTSTQLLLSVGLRHKF